MISSPRGSILTTANIIWMFLVIKRFARHCSTSLLCKNMKKKKNKNRVTLWLVKSLYRKELQITTTTLTLIMHKHVFELQASVPFLHSSSWWAWSWWACERWAPARPVYGCGLPFLPSCPCGYLQQGWSWAGASPPPCGRLAANGLWSGLWWVLEW